MTITLTSAPALINLKGPAAFPFSLTLNLTGIDGSGNPIPWSSFSMPEVFLSSIYSTIPPSDLPTVVSPSDGEYVISWNADQTTLLAKVRGLRWYFATSISGTPYDLLAGSLQFVNPSLAQPSGTTYDLSVKVGTATVNLAAELGSGGGGAGVMSVTAADSSVVVDNTHPATPTVKVSPTFVPVGAVMKAGDTMTGPLVLSGDPTADLQASTRRYVDATRVYPHVRVAGDYGLVADGVTDNAAAINAIPANAGIIHWSGTLLCKAPIATQDGVWLDGQGHGTTTFAITPGGGVIKFDPTAEPAGVGLGWGPSPKLVTIGDPSGNIFPFGSGLSNCTIDCQSIPGCIGAYSSTAQEGSGLSHVKIAGASQKIVWFDGSQPMFAINGSLKQPQNYLCEEVEGFISAAGAAAAAGLGLDIIGYDFYGQGSDTRGSKGLTAYNLGYASHPGKAAFRHNGSSGAFSNLHGEGFLATNLVGDQLACRGLTIDSSTCSSVLGATSVDQVQIAIPAQPTTFAGTGGTALSALGTLPLASVANMVTSGSGTIVASDGTHTFTYTGISGASLTGCTYSGSTAVTVASGAAVTATGLQSTSCNFLAIKANGAAGNTVNDVPNNHVHAVTESAALGHYMIGTLTGTGSNQQSVKCSMVTGGVNASPEVLNHPILFGRLFTLPGVQAPVVLKTSAYTVQLTDSDLIGDPTSGSFAFTLPDATTCKGSTFTFLKTGPSTNTVSVTPFGTQSIAGATGSVILVASRDSITIYSDGSNWRVQAVRIAPVEFANTGSAQSWTVPATGTWELGALGPGGNGGTGGTATGGGVAVGGGGGSAGTASKRRVSLNAGTTLTHTDTAAGTNSNWVQSGTTLVTGKHGSNGVNGAAGTTTAGGGVYGSPGSTSGTPSAGNGGAASSTSGGAPGDPSGEAPSGGTGGAPATAALGGNGGSAGSASTVPAAVTGTTATTSGAAGASGTDSGSGGGGGGAASTGGTPGSGGTGGPGKTWAVLVA